MSRSALRSIVHEAPDDPSLTARAGLLLVSELAERTHLVERLDAAIDELHPFKQRRRGSSVGELLVSPAE